MIKVLERGIENAQLLVEARQFMPVLNVYALIQWTLRGKSEGHARLRFGLILATKWRCPTNRRA